MKQPEKNNTTPQFITPLYRHIFYGRFSSVVVFVLLGSILLQPIDRAYASDSVPNEAVPAPIDTTASIVTPSNQTVADASPTVPPIEKPADPAATVSAATTTSSSEVSSVPSTTPPLPPPSTEASTTDIVSTVVPQTSDTAESTTTSDVAASTTVLTDATSTSASTTTATIPDSPSNPLATTTKLDTSVVPQKNSPPPAAATSTEPDATSTATTTGDTFTITTTPTESDTQIQFDKTDCVAVADGSYYCHTKTPAPTTAVKDGLYSQPDADGDLEIYFAKNGVLEQITHNQVDDASPYYDSISNTIVWHRLINDRYQIISYDIKSGAESQITTDSVNNMEPTRAGKYTVWQHWNNNNWDIMLYDGATIKLLTDTPQHDIAPMIRGNLVMWNRLTNDKKQTIELYDLTTGEYTTINDTEGGALSNPRMVLVYDAQFENGDVVTKGYDVATGKITPLSSVPASIPDKIPEPDKTGETRALIQVKSTTREDSDQIISPKPTIDPPLPPATSTATSSIASSTLTIASATATTSPDTATTTPLFTLDLTPTTTVQISPQDIIIPSFVASSTTE